MEKSQCGQKKCRQSLRVQEAVGKVTNTGPIKRQPWNYSSFLYHASKVTNVFHKPRFLTQNNSLPSLIIYYLLVTIIHEIGTTKPHYGKVLKYGCLKSFLR